MSHLLTQDIQDQLRDQPIQIVEVGPRDGLQNIADVLPVEARVRFIEALVDAGHRDIEIGSFVHPRWIPQMAHTAEVFAALRRHPDARYWALVPNMRGLDDALHAGMTHLAIFISASETHNRRNLNRSIDQSLAQLTQVTATARAAGASLRGYVSAVFGCPYEGAVDFARVTDITQALLDMGVHQVSLGDTIGVGEPLGVEPKLRGALERFGPERLALHLHDTRGVALVIALLALRLGMRTFDSSAGGLGGCPYAPGASGNLATEDFVNLLDGLGVDHGIDLDALVRISSMLQAEHGLKISSRYVSFARSQRADDDPAAPDAVCASPDAASRPR